MTDTDTVHQAAGVIEDALSRSGDPLDIARALKRKGLLVTGYVINVADMTPGTDAMFRLDHIREAYQKGLIDGRR